MTRSLLAATVFLAACAAPAVPVPSPRADIGAELFRRLFEQGFSRGDRNAVKGAVAAEFVLHARGKAARIAGAELWDLAAPIRTGFPDIRFTVDEVITQGSRTAARLRFVGTHRGPWAGIAATGRQVEVTETFVCRIESERLAECWQEWDELGLLRQLGAAP